MRKALLLLSCIFALAFAAAPVSHGAKASSGAQPTCLSLRVVLHGKDKPTGGCVRYSTSNSVTHATTITPFTYRDDGCGSNDLRLYKDANYTGGNLCLAGSGFINLTSVCYWYEVGCNWNDVVSSYISGGYAGRLYQNINGGDPDIRFWVNQFQPYVGNSFNDQASSVCISATGDPYGCPGNG